MIFADSIDWPSAVVLATAMICSTIIFITGLRKQK